MSEEPHSSFFVLFEFKAGLILSLITYWNLVNISATVSLAINRWSENFGSREPKNFMLLQAILLEKFGNTPSNKKRYLRQIEFAILSMIENFFTDISNTPIGDFRYDEIVRYEINSEVDFPGFVKLCEEKKGMADQRPFWKKYKKELDGLIADADFERNYKPMHDALSRIQSDLKYAYMVNTNKVVGDAVIAVDTRENTRILTTDKSFETIAPILAKKIERIPNKY